MVAGAADGYHMRRPSRLRRPRRGLILAAGAALMLLLTSCYSTPEGAWVSRNSGRRVALQGDSLVDMNDAQWRSGALAEEGSLAVWSVSGSQFHHAGAWINGVSPRPDVFVIAQGLNSISGGWNAWDQAQLAKTVSYARYAGRAPRIPCIVLVTMAHGPGVPRWWANEAQEGSFHIRNTARSSSVYRLAEWRGVALSHPEWFLDDDVHLTNEGSEAYERVITDAVESC